MELFETWLAAVTNWLWGVPMAVLLLGIGIVLNVYIRFFPIRYFFHVIQQTFGSIFKKEKAEGSVTPFQAAASALASSVGAANIVGVPVAITLGGPGAVFWMWMVALISMGTKYSEIVLGMKYRVKNEKGDWVGGPMYYIRRGLGWNKVAVFFSFFLLLQIFASIMVQSNSLSQTVEASFQTNTLYTGIGVAVLIGIISFGGIQWIGRFTSRVIPLMVVLYIGSVCIILFNNLSAVPEAFGMIFYYAFNPISAAGGFAGAGVAAALRFGLARGIYSNEAGMGTAPIAHSTAMTDHPSKQGMWGVAEVFVDTIVVCTMTALLILTTDVWTGSAADDANAMVVEAFASVMGAGAAGTLVSIALFCFVLSTILVIVFYGEKQAEYLFGFTVSIGVRVLYLAAIVLGAIGGLQFVWQFLDFMLAMIIIPNIIALFFLRKDVAETTKDYVSRYLSKK
ncbi:sodium:alanine symporter family protein [Sinobaca sp. H24]|uniref:alanine/glycine:cation symporter family protein n=1 Tax=Sinobaca sp. H24 TaxID=2923376 RepID=UPI00207A463C|nr:sodium:alanine symporter family protein [Sinobaca sp. H24]